MLQKKKKIVLHTHIIGEKIFLKLFLKIIIFMIVDIITQAYLPQGMVIWYIISIKNNRKVEIRQ